MNRVIAGTFFLCNFSVTYGMDHVDDGKKAKLPTKLHRVSKQNKHLQVAHTRTNVYEDYGAQKEPMLYTKFATKNSDASLSPKIDTHNSHFQEPSLFTVTDPIKIQQLLAAGAPVNARDQYNRTLLFVLLNRLTEHIDAARVLLANGAIPDCTHIDGDSLVYCLTMKGADKIKALELLFEYKADPNILTKNKRAPLHAAIEKKLPRLIKLLIRNGADVNIPNPICYQYPIQQAIEQRNSTFITFLLKHGANLNYANFFGHYPLHIAMPYFEHCYRYNKKDIEIILLLLDAVIIDPNIPYKDNTAVPLHIVVTIDRYDIVQKLLDRGARKDVRDAQGRTPYDIAKEFNHKQECINMLSYDPAEVLASSFAELINDNNVTSNNTNDSDSFELLEENDIEDNLSKSLRSVNLDYSGIL